MRVTKRGNVGLLENGKVGYTFEVSSVERSEIEQRANEKKALSEWEDHTISLGEYDVFPNGTDNNLPIEIRNTVNQHNLAPRIFTKKKLLLWGEGPMLMERSFVDGKPKVTYTEDNEIQDWLESWGHEDYLRQCIEDFNHCEGVYNKMFLGKVFRLGVPRIAQIEHVSNHIARLARLASRPNDNATHVITGDWHKQFISEYKAYPLFDKQQPDRHRVSILYSKMHGFASKNYARPDVVGSLAWIRRSTAIPFILEALTLNSLNIRWHIISPASYWESKEGALKLKCTAEGKNYHPQMLEDLKDEIFTQLAEVLSGQKNVGKFFQSESFYELIGTTPSLHKWEIIPLDQKIKDYVDAQLEISKRGDFATISGLGLHQALSNIGGDGKSDSGAEQLYAYKNHILSEVALPEAIVTQAINTAIKINWPNKKLKLGFYRNMPEREEDITPKDRIKNAV